MIKTRNVSKELYKNYLNKAEEYQRAMDEEYGKRHYNSSALCAIHCCISAADALTVFFKGVRHAGDRHEDAVQLLETLELDREIIKQKVHQFLSVLDNKNSVEYEEKLTSDSGAAMMIKQAKRFLDWAKSILPRS